VGHRDCTYVIFDADADMWAYGYMKGWKNADWVEFSFTDAHDVRPMTDRADDEAYIKAVLRKRFASSRQSIVLIGENTRYLYRFVRWEIEVALELELAIIGVNLNRRREMDPEPCPPVLRNEYAVHVPFKASIVRYALNWFPAEHARRGAQRGPRAYPPEVYASLGL
jgi:hypothetical protein